VPNEIDTSVEAGAEALFALLPDDEGDIGNEDEKAQKKEPDAVLEGDDDPEVDEDEAEDDDELQSSEDQDEESEEDAEEDDDAAEDQTFKVVVDGEEVEVTEAELLQGYSRTADYTRKTQKLAERREAQDAAETELQGVREVYDARLGMLEQALKETQGEEPDWDKVRRETPEQYPHMYANWQLQQQHLAKVREERKRVADEATASAQKRQAAFVAEETATLKLVMPEFADEAKAKALSRQLQEYGETQGFKREEVKGIADHRAIVILNKARLYDELQAKKEEVQKKGMKTPTIKPGSRAPGRKNRKAVSASKRARQRLRESGRVEDAAAAIELTLD
jgi:hypothetical protein